MSEEPRPEDWSVGPGFGVGKLVMIVSKIVFAGLKRLVVWNWGRERGA